MWSQDEKRKEILTLEIIKKEIDLITKERLSELAWDCFGVLPPILLVVIILLLARASLAGILISIGVFVPIWLYTAVRFLVFWFKNKKNKNSFTVVKEKLVGSFEEWRSARSKPSPRFFLFFSGYTKYAVPIECYKWSQDFCMQDSGVYNTAVEGNEFYLVVSGKRVLIAYNTKFFTLEDEN